MTTRLRKTSIDNQYLAVLMRMCQKLNVQVVLIRQLNIENNKPRLTVGWYWSTDPNYLQQHGPYKSETRACEAAVNALTSSE